MGYTHYWEFGEDPEGFDDFIEDIKKLSEEFGHLKRCEINEDEVLIDAYNGCDTFCVQRSGGWTFCKTAREHYDKLVCAGLISLHHQTGASVSSDGDFSNLEWAAGKRFYREVFEDRRIPEHFSSDLDLQKLEEDLGGDVNLERAKEEAINMFIMGEVNSRKSSRIRTYLMEEI